MGETIAGRWCCQVLFGDFSDFNDLLNYVVFANLADSRRFSLTGRSLTE
jgi:hypothetical protein